MPTPRTIVASLVFLSSLGLACGPAVAPAAPDPSRGAAARLPPPSATVGVAEPPPPAGDSPSDAGDTRGEGPDLALVVLIDRSGSMAGAPLEMVRAAALRAAGKLHANDLLEVIAFDTGPERVVRMSRADKARSNLPVALAAISAGGGTYLFPALDDAYQHLGAVSAGKKHVLLLTDGTGPADGLRDLALALASEGMTLSAVGLGGSVDVQLLRSLTDAAGGRFRAVTDLATLPDVVEAEIDLVEKAAR